MLEGLLKDTHPWPITYMHGSLFFVATFPYAIQWESNTPPHSLEYTDPSMTSFQKLNLNKNNIGVLKIKNKIK
jgi:hypothetical protein